jgi:Zinc finger, C3HC4 type (RING finger)
MVLTDETSVHFDALAFVATGDSKHDFEVGALLIFSTRLVDVMKLSDALERFSKMIIEEERMGGVPNEQAPKVTPQKQPDGPDQPVQNEQHAQEQQEHGPAPEGARGGELPHCILCRDKPAEVGFEHCNHFSICIHCAASMEYNRSITRCPVCRAISRLITMW